MILLNEVIRIIQEHHVLRGLFWSGVTIAFYFSTKWIYRCKPRWWTSPLAWAPFFLIGLALILHISYEEYIQGTHWLVTMLGPVTVAFAIPIFEHRRLIRSYWLILMIGVLVGDVIAIFSAWALANLFGLSDILRLSLLPRSISTPFAITVSGEIGGIPDLTAIFVVLTGIFGAALGEIMLAILPLRTSMAKGALFGMGAHGAGVAQARGVGTQEGAIASLVMILAGLTNVLAAPILAYWLR